MNMTLLTTKLYLPIPRPDAVSRPRLVERLDAGFPRKLTLVSAPAGYGKSTLLSAWLTEHARATWLSLDADESDPTRFLLYLLAALGRVIPGVDEGAIERLAANTLVPYKALLTTILNHIEGADPTILVLDDYHMVQSEAIDDLMGFLIAHLPASLHLVIASRTEPPFVLARLRAHGDLVELRAADLRFTPDEAAAYFAHAAPGMDARAAAALVEKTDGWVAGLQLAALWMRGHTEVKARVEAFTGNDAFVLDYLVEEVLTRQPAELQRFLFTTAVLERLCGPLCDALTGDPPGSGQAMLEVIERANLFLIPLDAERRWYRYHHLFADMLRQRASDHMDLPASHQRASRWYEAHDLLTEAFGHAAAAGDLDAAERLLNGGGTPLAYRGAPGPVVRWLASLPASVLNMRPALWVAFASAGMISGQPMPSIEARLKAAEIALRQMDENASARDLMGQVAAIRATLAINTGDAAAMYMHSQQALDYLPQHRVALRTSALYTLGYAQQLRGERNAARQSYHEVLLISESTDNTLITIAVLTCLGQVEESDLHPDAAAAFFQRVLALTDDPPIAACEAHLGLARIAYQREDFARADDHLRICIAMTAPIRHLETAVAAQVLAARLYLASGDMDNASAAMRNAEARAKENALSAQLAVIAGIRLNLGSGFRSEQAAVAEHIPAIARARLLIAQGDPEAALRLLEPVRLAAEQRHWHDECLNFLIVEALAWSAHGRSDMAARAIDAALRLAAPAGYLRPFLDEGVSIVALLQRAVTRGVAPHFTAQILERAARIVSKAHDRAALSSPVLTLTGRELDVLRLIAEGLSNQAIGDRLFLALDTVKGCNRRIFDKLGVGRRTEAVARARTLGLL